MMQCQQCWWPRGWPEAGGPPADKFSECPDCGGLFCKSCLDIHGCGRLAKTHDWCCRAFLQIALMPWAWIVAAMMLALAAVWLTGVHIG